MTKSYRLLALFSIIQFSLFFIQFPSAYGQEIAEVLASGQKAFAEGNYVEAEKFFGQAEQMEPDNYKALRSLAEAKIKLKKYSEAEKLLDRILKMPPAKGRNILVYLPGETESQEAELVDETVMAVDESAKADEPAKKVSKFLKDEGVEPVPHYRVYLKKTGKMKLTPKSKTRIKYSGIPTATRELVISLKTQVRKKMVSTLNAKPEEDMIAVPGGCFQMGSNNGDPDEKPVHEICLSPFKMDKYEVRQKHYQAVIGLNPSQNVGPDLPVESITWDDASDYCKKLGMRLPTEAEWEFAARAGSKTEFYWGDTLSGKEANFCDGSCELNIREPRVTDGFKHTAPVGSFPPNPLGLYDMAGNVNEWVFDWVDVEKNYYMMSPRKDPPGPYPHLEACMGVKCAGSQSITQKIYRGGAWNQKASQMRSANRKDSHFQLRLEGTGFRCAISRDITREK